jgi:hypothetical protein
VDEAGAIEPLLRESMWQAQSDLGLWPTCPLRQWGAIAANFTKILGMIP